MNAEWIRGRKMQREGKKPKGKMKGSKRMNKRKFEKNDQKKNGEDQNKIKSLLAEIGCGRPP